MWGTPKALQMDWTALADELCEGPKMAATPKESWSHADGVARKNNKQKKTKRQLVSCFGYAFKFHYISYSQMFSFFLSTCHPKQPKNKQNRWLVISSAQQIILIPTVEFSFIAASGSERCLYKLDLCLGRKENIFHTVPLWLWLMWANKERGKKKMGTLGEKNSKLISLATVRTSQGIFGHFSPLR